MNSLEIIENAFKETELEKLNNKISDIGDLLEGSNLCREEVIKAINYLFEHVKNYEDETIIENILNVSLNIMNAYKIFSGFDLNSLISQMDRMSYECISYVLTFLGYSRDTQYIKIIEHFLNIEELKETSIIETAIGIPLGTMNKTDSSGTEKTYVVLAVSYIALQQ